MFRKFWESVSLLICDKIVAKVSFNGRSCAARICSSNLFVGASGSALSLPCRERRKVTAQSCTISRNSKAGVMSLRLAISWKSLSSAIQSLVATDLFDCFFGFVVGAFERVSLEDDFDGIIRVLQSR